MVQATLDGLIREVQRESPDVLDQLEIASQRAAELADLGDSLLTHFVDRCRTAGRTWAEIGAHLGVTRQAAQKRFVDSVGDTVTLERFTMKARQVLDASADVAASMRHNYVGTEHQLVALFDADDALAARALTELGTSRAELEQEVLARVRKGTKAVSGLQPLTPRARKVLEEAVNAAADLGHNYVGTEHLLLGLYRGQDGVALHILNALGITRDLAKQKVVDLLAGFNPKTGRVD
jgi:hypothetical protein